MNIHFLSLQECYKWWISESRLPTKLTPICVYLLTVQQNYNIILIFLVVYYVTPTVFSEIANVKQTFSRSLTCSKTCPLRKPTVRLQFVRKMQMSAKQRDVMVTRYKHEMNESLQKLFTKEKCPPNSVSTNKRFYCSLAMFRNYHFL